MQIDENKRKNTNGEEPRQLATDTPTYNDLLRDIARVEAEPGRVTFTYDFEVDDVDKDTAAIAKDAQEEAKAVAEPGPKAGNSYGQKPDSALGHEVVAYDDAGPIGHAKDESAGKQFGGGWHDAQRVPTSEPYDNLAADKAAGFANPKAGRDFHVDLRDAGGGPASDMFPQVGKNAADGAFSHPVGDDVLAREVTGGLPLPDPAAQGIGNYPVPPDNALVDNDTDHHDHRKYHGPVDSYPAGVVKPGEGRKVTYKDTNDGTAFYEAPEEGVGSTQTIQEQVPGYGNYDASPDDLDPPVR